jgi:hypothetical protein
VTGRSVDPCPACGAHTLALEQPPDIPVMGEQPNNELYRMGDLPMHVGGRCRSCGTWWPTISSLRAGEPGTPLPDEPDEGLDAAIASSEPGRPPAPAGLTSTLVAVVAMAVGVLLAIAGFLEVAFLVVGGAMLAWSAWRRRRTSVSGG